MVKTPVPTMLPMTRPVAEVRPKAWAFASLRGVGNPSAGAGGAGGGAVVSDIESSFHASPLSR
jgi:hypothetical protein